jgi:two-component system, OmpR family, sensor histidine kinase KdpD
MRWRSEVQLACKLGAKIWADETSDTGPDLPPGEPERLFAKFERGRDEADVGGAGLGLAICRAIVNAHGGQITAMQRPGGGARFMFTLPTTAP